MTDTAPQPVAFVDTETTGLDPDRHEIWEVGLILPDGSEHEWQLPVDLSRADPIALNIGRFHERRWKWDSVIGVGQPAVEFQTNPARFAFDFVRLTRGLHLAGAVVSFDADRLWRLLRANGQCPMWHYHLIDVEGLAAGWLAGRGCKPADDRGYGADPRPPWRSDALSMAVGVDPDDFDRHTALGDARWAKAIYEAVMG
jgi:hypothetical protein